MFFIYGLLMLKLSPIALTAKISNNINGAIQLPVEISKELLNVAINEANSRISELKKEYNSIVAVNQDLQAKIDKSIDLKKLQTVASEKFGMVRPERYQMFYVDMQLGDYAENVAKEKVDDVKEKVAVMGVPGTIISAMKMFK